MRERHLPAGRQRQLVGHVVGALAEVRVLLRRARGGGGGCGGAQQRGGRGVRADVLRPGGGGGAQAGRVAARVGAGLAGVRARVGLLEEGLGKDLLPPRAGLGVQHRVEERLELRVQVLRDVDHLLARRRRRARPVHLRPRRARAGGGGGGARRDSRNLPRSSGGAGRGGGSALTAGPGIELRPRRGLASSARPGASPVPSRQRRGRAAGLRCAALRSRVAAAAAGTVPHKVCGKL